MRPPTHGAGAGRVLELLLAAVLVVGCDVDDPTAPPPSPPASSAPAASSASAGAVATPAAATPTLLRVADLADGDSFTATDGVEYRVGLINTPELSACGGPDAAQVTADLLADGFTADGYAEDDVGRTVARITLADGRDLGVVLAVDGWADDRYLETFRHEHPAYAAEVEPAFARAREVGAGLWATCWTPSATAPAPASAVRIADLVHDTAGNDVEFGTSEHVVLAADGTAPADVGGWTITDEAGHVLTIPDGYRIAPGTVLRIHTGPGEATSTAWFAAEDQAIWNNSGGDAATLRDAGGEVVDTFAYRG